MPNVSWVIGSLPAQILVVKACNCNCREEEDRNQRHKVGYTNLGLGNKNAPVGQICFGAWHYKLNQINKMINENKLNIYTNVSNVKTDSHTTKLGHLPEGIALIQPSMFR